MGNQSVQYSWTLHVSATPTSFANGVTVFVEVTYFDTYPGRPYYSETYPFTLNSNGQDSQDFSACMVPSTIYPESSVGIKVVGVRSATDQSIPYTSSGITIIPED